MLSYFDIALSSMGNCCLPTTGFKLTATIALVRHDSGLLLEEVISRSKYNRTYTCKSNRSKHNLPVSLLAVFSDSGF